MLYFFVFRFFLRSVIMEIPLFLVIIIIIIIVVVVVVVVVIIIIVIIIMLELHTEQVLIQWLNLLRFCVDKTPQTSRIFWRILAEYTIVVSSNSTILASIPISLNYCFNFSGAVPNAPPTTGITFTGISHIFFTSFYRLL